MNSEEWIKKTLELLLDNCRHLIHTPVYESHSCRPERAFRIPEYAEFIAGNMVHESIKNCIEYGDSGDLSTLSMLLDRLEQPMDGRCMYFKYRILKRGPGMAQWIMEPGRLEMTPLLYAKCSCLDVREIEQVRPPPVRSYPWREVQVKTIINDGTRGVDVDKYSNSRTGPQKSRRKSVISSQKQQNCKHLCDHPATADAGGAAPFRRKNAAIKKKVYTLQRKCTFRDGQRRYFPTDIIHRAGAVTLFEVPAGDVVYIPRRFVNFLRRQDGGGGERPNLPSMRQGLQPALPPRRALRAKDAVRADPRAGRLAGGGARGPRP